MPARSVQRSRQRLPGQNTCPGILVLREAPGLRHMLVSGSCARLVCVRGPSVCQGNEPLKVAYRLWNLRCRANRRKLETREADPRELDFPYHLRVRVWLLRCLVRFLAVVARLFFVQWSLLSWSSFCCPCHRGAFLGSACVCDPFGTPAGLQSC